MRSAVKNRILNKDLNSGVKSTYYPWFNKYLKGFRKGEFTVFTGPTGSGKTTFLSQLSLDFASAGVPTLWCSFELKNEVLLSTMLNQYAGVDLAKEPNRFDFVADKFENVPMYFQTYFGSTHVDDVTTMIDYAIYTHDVGHVVIDNLQFMLSGQGRGMERFDMQDDVVAKLRKMATTHNVHITLVIHPRKGEDGADLTVSSIFGTAKSTQEADNVIILQQRDKYRVIDIKKNRHDGEIGKAALWFDRHSKRFEQATAREIELLSTGTPVEEILEKRSRQVNPEAVAYHTFEEQDDMRVPKLTHRPDSVVTDENLHRVLARKNTPREHRHYSKAFHRLDEIQSALSRNSREEPDPQDFANIITISLEQPHMAPISSTPAREREQPREEDTSTDPFEIHYEGNYGAVGKSFKLEGRETSKVESRQTDRLPLEGTNQSAPQEEADNIFEQPFNARVLQGFSSDEKVETLDDLTAGEVIFTYDQLIEGQAGYPKKQQSKARSSRTDGSIQYKRKSAKAENQPKNEK